MIQGPAWIPSGIMMKSELSWGLMWSLVWVLNQDLNRTYLLWVGLGAGSSLEGTLLARSGGHRHLDALGQGGPSR